MDQQKEKEVPIVHSGEHGHQQYRGTKKIPFLPNEIRQRAQEEMEKLEKKIVSEGRSKK